jgi:hypothetical protein
MRWSSLLAVCLACNLRGGSPALAGNDNDWGLDGLRPPESEGISSTVARPS